MATLYTDLRGTLQEMTNLFNTHNIRYYECINTDYPNKTSEYTWKITIRDNEPEKLSRIKKISSMQKRLDSLYN